MICNYMVVLEQKMVGVAKSCVKNYASWASFVPAHQIVDKEKLAQLQDFVDAAGKLLVLTGAGVSTESGIPDYRSEGVGLYARGGARPIQYQDFMKSAKVRQRYWARNFAGWPRFSAFKPNKNHHILADWEKLGKISALVTQNVDSLHTKAGSRQVIELHGCAHRVTCTSCNSILDRHTFQQVLKRLNTNLSIRDHEIRPDGDVELPQEFVDNFKVPFCDQCGDKGFLKPDIVFFGDNVPKERVHQVMSGVGSCDSLLIVGSSLQVYSGYRFLLKARELGKPAAIINIGPTRGDDLAQLKLSAKCSDILSKICV